MLRRLMSKAIMLDDFNRADGAPGASWRLDRGVSPVIATNRIQYANQGSSVARAGGWISYQGQLNTDNYGVKAQLIAPTTSTAADNMTGLVLAVNDTFGAGTMCYFVGCQTSGTTNTSGCKIMTQSGLPPTSGLSTGQTGQTVRASVATPLAPTDLIEFTRVGTLFTVYRNGSSFLTWDDSGLVVPTGAANRRFGLFVEGNHPFAQSQYESPAIDSIQAYDI